MKGRYGIRGAPDTGEGKTFIKGGSPQMIDRHPERLIRGHDADVGGGPELRAELRDPTTADVSAEQGQERVWTIYVDDGYENRVLLGPGPGCHAVEVVLRDRAEKAEADNRALVEAIESYMLWEPGRAGHAEAHRNLAAALDRVQEGKP